MFSFLTVLIAIFGFRHGLKFGYLLAIGATLFVLLPYRTIGFPVEGFLAALIFNLTPLIPEVFRRHFTEIKDDIYSQLDETRKAYRELLQKEDLIQNNNRILEKEMQDTASLYEITREMSSALDYEGIFKILSDFMVKTFGDFKGCRLILVDDTTQPAKIGQVFQAGEDEAKLDEADQRLYEIMNQLHKRLVLTANDRDTLYWQKLMLDEETSSFIAVPLVVDNQLVAILSARNLDAKSFEKFLIIASQFSLEIKKVRIYKKVEEMAITDGLTNLYTRRYFNDRLNEEQRRSLDHHFNFSFLMIDIDRFKSYNDRFGHLVGDMVLKKVAEIIRANIREVDLAARYGGEEFAVLLPETTREGAEQVAGRIRLSTEKYNFRVYDEQIRLTVSIGVAVFPEDGRRPSTIINHADQALYRAKKEGRNKVIFFDGFKTD